MFTQPLVLERNSGLKEKEKEGKLISNLFNFHNLIVKVEIPRLMLFMLCFMLKSFFLHMYVSVFVEYVWEGLKWFFLIVFSLVFCFDF